MKRTAEEEVNVTVPEATLTKKQTGTLNLWQVKRILMALQKELSSRSTISQAVVLMAIAEHGTILLQDLSAETKISAPTISRITAILGDVKYYAGKKGKDLITVTHTDFDRKQKQASLTNYGKLFIKDLFYPDR